MQSSEQTGMPAKKTISKGGFLLKRKNFIYLFVVVILSFGLKDYIVNSLISIDEDHKEILKVLAEQNMLSQRITKLALLIQNDLEKDTVANSRPDSLARHIPRWQANHEWLVHNNIKHTDDDYTAEQVSFYINECTRYVEVMSSAGMQLLAARGKSREIVDRSVSIIDRYELPYHDLIERSIQLYNKQMAEEYRFLTRLQYFLSAMAILVLVIGFAILIIPIMNKLVSEIELRKVVETNLTKAVENYLVSESRLNQSKKDLEEIQEAINRSALVTITDTSGTIQQVNDLFCEVTGYSREDLVGQNHRIISSHSHPRGFWEDFWATIKAGKSWKGEVNNRAKDGREIWMDTVINPIMNQSGGIRQFLAIRMDITDKKRAERRAERLNYELLAISNTYFPVGIISIDTSGNIVLFSKGAETLLGYSADEVVGHPPMIFHDEEEVLERATELTRVLKKPISPLDAFLAIPEIEGYESREWTYIRKDGQRIPVQLIVSPIRESDGRIAGHVGIAIDISDRIKAEKAMRYAMEQAEDANRSKSQFLANMSHEIRTPLNSILGFSEILDDVIQDQKQKGYLNTIITSGRTLLSLINDLLNIAKVDAGKLEIENRETDLAAVAREVGQMFDPELRNKKLHLSIETADNFPGSIMMDDVRMRQVLINLVGNAVKFTHQGFVRVYLEGSASERHSGHIDLRIRVQDSGIGIDPRHHERIFEAFHQVLDTTTSQYGGTGLGLSISKKLIELMGGTIMVESEQGRGSTFTITVPGVKVVRAAGTPVKPIDQPKIDEDLRLASATCCILIVDDVQSNIDLILGFLEDYPCRKLVARGGEEAVVIARQHRPDIILMDLKMPVMDGWEATRQIRRIEALKDTPIIACTANVLGLSEREDIFDGVIIKPFRRILLLEELKKFMIRRKALQAARKGSPEELKELIGHDLLGAIRSRFGSRLSNAAENFDVQEMEKLLKEVEDFLRENHVKDLEEHIKAIRTDFENFDLDALAESIKVFNRLLEV